MLSVIAHLTSLAFVVWTAYYVIRRIDGRPDPEGRGFVLCWLLAGLTALFFFMR